MPLAYASMLVGALVLIAGLTGSTIPSVAKGNPDRAKAKHPGREQASSTSSTSAPAASSAPSGPWRSTQAAIAHQRGWSLADWNQLIQMESGGDPTAQNPSTGAFGIGQLNPENAADPFNPRPGSTAAKYRHLGALSRNPVLQIKAMAAYIADTYGNPTNALAHEHAAGWY